MPAALQQQSRYHLDDSHHRAGKRGGGEGSDMREHVVRSALRRDLEIRHADEKALILDELGVEQGKCRVDIAVVNGFLAAFEIKSAADTLDRLPRQLTHYGRVFDFITVVTEPSHRRSVERLLPRWCGISIYDPQIETEPVLTIREPELNNEVDPSSLVQLLWRDEVADELKRLGATRGLLRQPRRVLWQELATQSTLDQLRETVRECLKKREGWRSAQ